MSILFISAINQTRRYLSVKFDNSIHTYIYQGYLDEIFWWMFPLIMEEDTFQSGWYSAHTDIYQGDIMVILLLIIQEDAFSLFSYFTHI